MRGGAPLFVTSCLLGACSVLYAPAEPPVVPADASVEHAPVDPTVDPPPPLPPPPATDAGGDAPDDAADAAKDVASDRGTPMTYCSIATLVCGNQLCGGNEVCCGPSEAEAGCTGSCGPGLNHYCCGNTDCAGGIGCAFKASGGGSPAGTCQ
jgi:hypothetical protein